MHGVGLVLVIIVVIIALVVVGIFMHFLGVWIRALMSGAKVSLWSLVGMKLRRVPPAMIVDARISLVKAGLLLETDEMEAHYLANGDVLNVCRALIAADKANIDLSFQRAAAIDLAGRDRSPAVQRHERHGQR